MNDDEKYFKSILGNIVEDLEDRLKLQEIEEKEIDRKYGLDAIRAKADELDEKYGAKSSDAVRVLVNETGREMQKSFNRLLFCMEVMHPSMKDYACDLFEVVAKALIEANQTIREGVNTPANPEQAAK